MYGLFVHRLLVLPRKCRFYIVLNTVTFAKISGPVPTNIETQHSPVILDLWLKKTRAGKSHDYCDAIVFKTFSVHRNQNENPAFSNSFGLKSVFEKLYFRDGLVRTVRLTVEIKLRFKISPASVVWTLGVLCIFREAIRKIPYI